MKKIMLLAAVLTIFAFPASLSLALPPGEQKDLTTINALLLSPPKAYFVVMDIPFTNN